MSGLDASAVRAAILQNVEPQLAVAGLEISAIADDFDLRAEGIVDSLGLVALLSGLEAALGRDIDLGDLDPEDLMRVGPLSRHIAAQLSSAAPPKP